MDLFTHQYESLIDYARGVIYNRHLTIDPSDLVNDAYLKFAESGKEFDVKEFKKIISNFGYKESHENLQKNDLSTAKKQYTPKEQVCCSKCHEVKPVNAFPIDRVDGYIIVRKKCKTCVNERRRELNKINPRKGYYKPKPIPLALAARNKPPGRPKKYKYDKGVKGQQQKNICFKEWVKNNREKWNAYMRERNRLKKNKAA